MSLVFSRRTLTVAALFAIAGCSGMPSASVPPSTSASSATHSSLSSAQALRVGALPFVHAGMPYALPGPAHARSKPSVRYAYTTKQALTLEGDQAENAVNIYLTKDAVNNPPPIATITDNATCPYGMAFDKTGRLYVANNCGASTITEYPKGSTTHDVVISNGISNPLGVAIDKSGNLWVSNYPASLTEYAPGGTSPIQTITGGGLADPFGLAFDTSGNLFIADFGASQVFELPPGSTTVQALNLQDLTEPLGVAIDRVGNLWVTDGAGNKVNVYPPGSTSPSRTISGSEFVFPYAISSPVSPKCKKCKVNMFISNINSSQNAIYGFKQMPNTPYATLTNGITLPTGVLTAKPSQI